MRGAVAVILELLVMSVGPLALSEASSESWQCVVYRGVACLRCMHHVKCHAEALDHGCRMLVGPLRASCNSGVVVRPLLVLRGGSAPLPYGWEEFVDDEYKIPYFYNAATGETVWERPEHSSPAVCAPTPQQTNHLDHAGTISIERGGFPDGGGVAGTQAGLLTPGPLPQPPGPPPQGPGEAGPAGASCPHGAPAPPQPPPAESALEPPPPLRAPSLPLLPSVPSLDTQLVAQVAAQGATNVAAAAAQGATKLSKTNIAGLKVFKSEHGGVLRDYGLGVLQNAIDLASSPLEHLMDGIGSVGDAIFSKADRMLGHASDAPPQDALLRTSYAPDLGHTREEWQVAQGTNVEGYDYTSYRHRRTGMLLELCHESYGSFNFKLSDGKLVRRVTAITDFIIENRDYLHHEQLAEELQKKSDSDEFALFRFPVVPSGNWEARCLKCTNDLHSAVIIRHKSQYDKNNVTLVLIPDGFIFFSRGDTCNLTDYKTREALIVRSSAEAIVSIDQAKKLFVKLVGPLRGLTHFSAVVDKEPLDYDHLLEEGQRIQGHDRCLEEKWIWREKRWRVVWAEHYDTYAIALDDLWARQSGEG